MDKYIHEDYSGCIEIFESLIEDDNIIACDKAILYTNIAAAELGLEMARKCKIIYLFCISSISFILYFISIVIFIYLY